MKKLDKKQIPQFAALCVLTAGVFGYFIVRLATPGPAAAGTLPRAAAVTPVAQTASVTPAAPQAAAQGATASPAPDTAATAADPAGNDSDTPPPTLGMRDPFVVGYVDPKTAPPAAPAPLSALPKLPASLPQKLTLPKMGQRMASLPPVTVSAPFAPPLPLSRFSPRSGEPILPPAPAAPALPAPPAAPAWTVTGVLQSAQEQIAILRSGEARRIVRAGDFVDSVYRVVDVTRSSVTLRHGKTYYQLNLGAIKAVPAKAVSMRAAPSKAEPREADYAPPPPALRPATSLPVALGHARDAATAQVAMRLLDDQTPGLNDARAHLELGLALYQSGRMTEGRAQWQRVLTMDDFDAADEAGKLLGSCP